MAEGTEDKKKWGGPEDKRDFFRFYRDGFKETIESYRLIFEAFQRSGVIPKTKADGTAFEFKDFIRDCRIHDEEIHSGTEKINEKNIGMQGFITRLKEAGQGIYAEWKKKADEGKDGEISDDDDKAFNMKIGDAALKALREMKQEQGDLTEEQKLAYAEAEAFIGSLAAGPYFPRVTCASAAHFMGLGRIMEIGCSQGKTSVVAMSTYEQMQMGKKVFTTSSAPGLLPENYDEAHDFYDKMGVSHNFCAVSQNSEDKMEHIILFYEESDEKAVESESKTYKYEIRKDGSVYRYTGKKYKVQDENGKYVLDQFGNPIEKEEYVVVPWDEVPRGLKIQLSLIGEEGKETGFDFEKSVEKVFEEKDIVMADTITLGKYQHLLPKDKLTETGQIKDSILIVDEADAELFDTKPQEILGEEYTGKEAESRWNDRIRAREAIKKYKGDKGNSEGLSKLAEQTGIPLGFLVDAYEAEDITDEKFMVKTSKEKNDRGENVVRSEVFVMNPNTNVMIPASQGLTEAILASISEDGSRPALLDSDGKMVEVRPERVVIGETDIPEIFSHFERASLMSGTMEDKGLSMSEIDPEEYQEARKEYFQRFGPAIMASFSPQGKMKGVMKWKTVTPLTREEKGSIVITQTGIQRDDGNGGTISSMDDKFKLDRSPEEKPAWRRFLDANR